ncbi:MAG: hypothetical protein QXQ19_00470 [Candidatus Aenigmatarchaeota archaeon]
MKTLEKLASLTDPILVENVDSATSRIIRYNFDLVYAICGTEGSGKSTFAIFLAKLFNEFLKEKLNTNEDFFTIKEHIATDVLEYIEKCYRYRHKKYQIWIWDEAILDMFSREAMKKVNRKLVKFFAVNRSFNHIHLLVIPNLFYLDINIREHRIKSMFLTYYFQDDLSQRFVAIYSKDDLTRILRRRKYLSPLFSRPYIFIEKVPTNALGIPFPKMEDFLTPSEIAEYQRIKEELQDRVLEEILEDNYKKYIIEV